MPDIPQNCKCEERLTEISRSGNTADAMEKLDCLMGLFKTILKHLTESRLRLSKCDVKSVLSIHLIGILFPKLIIDSYY